MSNSDDDLKKLMLGGIIALIILIPACWKIVDWINHIGIVEFSIYFLISVGSIITYVMFKFLGKKTN